MHSGGWVVRLVKGVFDMLNKTFTKTDAEIHKDVLNELKWDTHVKETEVGVEVDKGVVTLTGTVSSFAKKRAAEDAAHRVTGVLDVANDIAVTVPGTFAHTDTEIAKAVRAALEWDVFVHDKDIQSTVEGGWVTLRGHVKTMRERDDAEKAIRHLAGVLCVLNEIEVKPAKTNPDEVRDAIDLALLRRAERECDRIKVDVKDGAVTLTGRVHSWREKQAILGSVTHASGVRTVTDRLTIDPYF